ncbi:hypothetical protein AGIG_G20819 [Arapaima gigas]
MGHQDCPPTPSLAAFVPVCCAPLWDFLKLGHCDLDANGLGRLRGGGELRLKGDARVGSFPCGAELGSRPRLATPGIREPPKDKGAEPSSEWSKGRAGAAAKD